MQDYIKMNGSAILQPDSGLSYSWETTYTSDTTRTQAGPLHATPMFTVESLGYEATLASVTEVKQILQVIMKGKTFTLHYFSPYYGAWRDGKFYVGKGSFNLGCLSEDGEYYESISFNMIGVDPV